MQAIILAAGMGKRLKQLTQNNTKCMVKVNSVPLINRTLSQLEQHDLSSKISRNGRQFLRIAIRNEAEDNILVKALKEILAQCSKQ